jgi:hypothetical protein
MRLGLKQRTSSSDMSEPEMTDDPRIPWSDPTKPLWTLYDPGDPDAWQRRVRPARFERRLLNGAVNLFWAGTFFVLGLWVCRLAGWHCP